MTISTDSQQEIIDAISAAQDFFMQHFEKGPVDLYNKAYSHGLKLSNAKLCIKGQALTIADLDAELLAVREAQSADFILGMDVSIDVSTCDSDAGHRLFGTVTEVSELDGAKNGYILLVQDAEANYTAPPAPAVPDAITVDNAPEIFEIAAQVERIGLSGAYGAYASGWNACRTAMLAAAPTPTRE
ncbi:Uncharacterised protein [Serratia fonticola]|uniref:hypothetical protein n=1 Tax=Serratia fonticola TaxID=47917 RepID=UPI002182D99C|nr:hypothetical protein [Serratia fonticola]CAI2144504.1 Uncharacterised protein [Serratia fonticola]